MKYIIILGDGMSDEPLEELGGKTPLEYAETPCMDVLAPKSEIGLAATVPDGMSPGSDTANLSVLGYDPEVYYTGRSPLEALSIGVDMEDDDIAIRCNLITVSEGSSAYGKKTMIDHSSGEIPTEDAVILIKALKAELEDQIFRFYPGTSYRHCTIRKKGSVCELTPPHDILGKEIGQYLPDDLCLREMMERSYDILNHHPLNEERALRGLNKANSVWFWGAGTKPLLPSFYEEFGKKGAMISAVDLLKGIAIGAGMTNINVDGADGTLHTDYEGKAEAAVRAAARDGYDFVYLHVEAPDEMGHQGDTAKKVRAIELLDKRVITNVMEGMERGGEDYRMLIMPDHATPIRTRTHSSEPVPYLLYDSRNKQSHEQKYNEKTALAAGRLQKDGYMLIRDLFQI